MKKTKKKKLSDTSIEALKTLRNVLKSCLDAMVIRDIMVYHISFYKYDTSVLIDAINEVLEDD